MPHVVLLVLGLLMGSVLPAGAPDPQPREDDPRWVFYTKDKRHWESPWWKDAHRKMVPYGCTSAPYYDPDPRCADDRGFHHGLDLAMPCGKRLKAGRGGRVVSPAALGPAYGEHPLLIRNKRLGVDFLLAHMRKVYVEEGDRVRRGTLLARASDSGAPDGCHLHVEVRTAGGGLSTARKPHPYLDLAVAKDG